MRDRDLAALEFDQVREELARFAASSAGKSSCRELRPSADRAVVHEELERAWQCLRLIDQFGNLPLGEFPDIRESTRKAAHEGFTLDGAALAEIRSVLEAAHITRSFLHKHTAQLASLATLPERLPVLPDIVATLGRALDDKGQVTDEASEELADVRRTLRHLRDKLTRRLEELVNRASMTDVLSDRYVTVRNNRFVVPVWSSAAPQFQGVVQDRSISGETTFIEPIFAVELNNRLLLAAKEEEALVRRVLADLTELVRGSIVAVEATFQVLVEIDALAARARYAQSYRGTQPMLRDDEIVLRGARHPLLLARSHEVVPIDLLMPRGKRVMVITGPNTGGKTVALKTFGVLALMAQSGMLLPAAEGSCLPCFGGIFADVGDAQSIERSLSTFSAHIANLNEILSSRQEPVLVLLDEPGVGTDPEEGAALGIGLIRILAQRGARVVVSTHYAQIKTFALGSDTCISAAVDFDIETLAARYRLVYHSVGESLALPIARRLGLPEPVLQAAQAARSEQALAFAAAMARLETTRRDYESRLGEASERARAAALAEEEANLLVRELREKKRQRWAQELDSARAFVRGVREQGRQLLATIESGGASRRELQRWTREQEQAVAKHEIAEIAETPVSSAPPQIGDEVEMIDSSIRGTLLAVEDERAWIQRGSLRFEVPASGLRRIATATPKPIAVQVAAPREDQAHEISLLGLRVKEALERLESFLDQAVRAGHGSVRIIHGIGSGALRRAVTEYLSGSHYCSSCRPGEASEGGAGVTIAELNC